MTVARYLMVLALAGLPIGVSASAYQGVVSNVWPHGGKVFVFLSSGSFDGAPSACPASGGRAFYSLDPNTAFGRALMATALSAKLSGRVVWVQGNGACAPSPLGDSESLNGIDLKG